MRPAASYLASLLLASVHLLFYSAAPPGDAEERLWRHRILGKAYFEDPAKTKLAVAELKQALELAPGSLRERLNYGLALLRAGEAKASIVELEKVQKQAPELPHTWFNLGVAYRRLGRPEEAVEQFKRMLQLTPDEAVAHFNLGRVYGLLDRSDEALAEFEAAARLDPALVAPRFQIFNTYRLRGDEARKQQAFAAYLEARDAQRKAGETEDMEWCYWAELYDPIAARPAPAPAAPAPALQFRDVKLAGTVDARASGMLALDLFGAHAADLLVWSKNGIALFRRGRTALAATGLGAARDVVHVAAGDFDNDGWPDLCVLSAQGATLYRNRKGRFAPSGVTLPAGRFEAALWLDFDHDYDLDLLLLGAQSTLVRNEGGGRFSAAPERFPFAPGHALAAAALRLEPDAKGIDVAVSYADHDGIVYRDRLRGQFSPAPLAVVPAGARSLAALDLDNDSRLDLAITGEAGTTLAFNRPRGFAPGPVWAAGGVFADLESRGFLDYAAAGGVQLNQGLARFTAAPRVAGFGHTAPLVAADFDGDGRTDLAGIAPGGSIHLLLNQTATKNRWYRVALKGVKNLASAAGAEVELRAGEQYQKQLYAGVPLVFGLGLASGVDTVRISWPNGLIQNQPRETVARTAIVKEAPRMSGSCPMVFTWDGRAFRFLADVLGVAPLGASAGDGEFFPVDSDEYVQIPPEMLAPRAGRYQVRIAEELHEVTYLDKVSLIAVDHPRNVEIFTNDKFKSPPFPEFRLFGVQRRIRPSAARDERGRDVRPALLARDRVYPTGFRRTATGMADMHSLELRFPSGTAPAGRAVLVLNGWIDWADGSTFLAAAQGGPGLVMPYLQVRDAAGQWRTVIEDMGAPSGGPKTIAVDLSGRFLSGSRDVRIVTNVCLYWDEVFLSEDLAPPAVRLTELSPEAAGLRLRGFSRAHIDPRREQPEYYEYADWRPQAMWDQVPGLYTRYGDVRELLVSAEDQFVIMGSGDELTLSFAARLLPPLAPDWTRDFLLLVDGWSKDADANTAHSRSVEPLPFHAMSRYPYPAAERFPDDAAHRAWGARYNTRREVRLMPPLAARHLR